jgi:diguanylate cyclase (GGDEF)-like protein
MIKEKDTISLFYVDEMSILYVEDDDRVRDGYSRTLRRLCKELLLASNGQEGLDLYTKYHPDIVVSDIKMPVMNGLEMTKRIKLIDPDAMIILTSAHSESEFLLEAINLQVAGYLIKPVQKKSLVTMIQKISKQITIVKEHKEQVEILQHIIDSNNSITIITNLITISFSSQSFLSLLNLTNIKEFNQKYFSLFDIFSKSSQFINKEIIEEQIRKGTNFQTYIEEIDEANRIAVIDDSNGDARSYYIAVTEVGNNNFLINFTDITQIEKERQESTKKAFIDGLTAVYNRYKLKEVFAQECNNIQRDQTPLSLAILDIDFFKKVNDTYGHLIGDEILISLADDIQRHTRSSDLFVRWGGEEFVILFHNTELDDAIKSAELIRERVASLRHPIAGNITISFGLSKYRAGDTLDTLIHRADKALYRAKNSGRNCVKSEIG